MFVIRRIYDAATPHNRERLAQVQAILRAQFPGIKEATVRRLPDQLTNPLKYRFRSVLLVAEDDRAQHHVFRQDLRLGFDHQHCVGRAGNDEVEFGRLEVRGGGIEQVLAVTVANFRRADRALERNAR